MAIIITCKSTKNNNITSLTTALQHVLRQLTFSSTDRSSTTLLGFHKRQRKQDFRITPYINYACVHCLKKTKDRTILSSAIVLEDNKADALLMTQNA